ncbi:MAG TPA: hypothetical protein DEP72_06755 [Clostridiales bacterium]|nr:MAG: hypothetical protein A2Y18_02505 [Clostridiales bacterium GWD2_32_19]HCC07839.1 hypothetical protein [Clostridiales bacterium]
MRKILVSLLVVLFFLNTGTVFAKTLDEVKSDVVELKKKAIEKFLDVKEKDWYLENVAILTELGIISGYEDGTFKPNETITTAQFIKLVVTSLGHTDIVNGNVYWAREYIKKAYEIGITDIDYSSQVNYDEPINRANMAVIISRALKEEYDSDIQKYAALINDYSSIESFYKIEILNTYSKGIISGYPDGEFKPNNSLTRAEATTVIYRMLSKDDRVNVGELLLKAEEGQKAGADEYKNMVDSMGIKNDLSETAIQISKIFIENVKYGVNYKKIIEDSTEWEKQFDITIVDNDVTDENKNYKSDSYKQFLKEQIIANEIICEAEFKSDKLKVKILDGKIQVTGTVKTIYTSGTGDFTLNNTIEKDITIELINYNGRISISKIIN